MRHLTGLARVVAASRLPGLALKASEACNDRPFSVAPGAPLIKAVKTMHRFAARAVLVQDGGETVGILTDRDVLRHAQTLFAADVQVRAVHSSEFIVGSDRFTIERCLHKMLDADQSFLPIVGVGGKIGGLLSIHDICRCLADNLIDGVKPAEPATVADVLHAAHRQAASDGPPETSSIVRVPRDATVADAVLRMCARRTTSAVVAAGDESAEGTVEAVGVFTLSDLLRTLASGDGSSDGWSAAPVATHMAPISRVLSVEPSCPAFDAFDLLAQQGANHIVVAPGRQPASETDAAHCSGVLSMRALLRFVLDHA